MPAPPPWLLLVVDEELVGELLALLLVLELVLLQLTLLKFAGDKLLLVCSCLLLSCSLLRVGDLLDLCSQYEVAVERAVTAGVNGDTGLFSIR
jgi:hypothetical protein